MKKLRWHWLALSLLVVGCGPNWHQWMDFGNATTPISSQKAPAAPVRPVTESMISDENAHEMSQRAWDELDQEEFAVERESATRPTSE